MAVYWANDDKTGVIIHSDGRLTYLTSGEEFEAAVAMGPLPPRDFDDVVADDPRAAEPVTVAEIAATVGLDQSTVIDMLRAVLAAVHTE